MGQDQTKLAAAIEAVSKKTLTSYHEAVDKNVWEGIVEQQFSELMKAVARYCFSHCLLEAYSEGYLTMAGRTLHPNRDWERMKCERFNSAISS